MHFVAYMKTKQTVLEMGSLYFIYLVGWTFCCLFPGCKAAKWWS